jgi:ferredoxin-NADP reductase
LLIAGGAGIAQARSLLEAMPRGTVVIYRARSRRDVIFHQELAQLSHTRGGRIFYILGRRRDPGPASAMTAEGLRRLVPDLRRRDVFVCCSEGLTQEVVAILAALRLPKRQLHVETYSL